MPYELVYWLRLFQVVVIVGVKHLLKRPLRPVVILWVASLHLAVPVEREANLVELLAIVVDVLVGCDGRMLPSLYGILLGGQTISVVAHGVEHVESLEALVARVDVGGYIAKGMPHVQSCARWVRKHVEHIIFWFFRVFRHLVGLIIDPLFLPFLLNLPEIVIHCFANLFIFKCKDTKKLDNI